MAFKRKRGRPALPRPKIDLGTAELQQKRNQGLTDEPVDICLSRGLINEGEHQAARRLVWLYRLRNGKPWVSAHMVDDTEQSGPYCEDNEAWQTEKEQDLHQALSLLDSTHTRELVLNVCVFQHYPAFLRHAAQSQSSLQVRERDYNMLRYGLGTLSRHWKCDTAMQPNAPTG